MRDCTLTAFVKYQDWRWQRRLHRDEQGLSLLAYALGAAVVVAPLAIAIALFGQGAVSNAEQQVGSVLCPVGEVFDSASGQCVTPGG